MRGLAKKFGELNWQFGNRAHTVANLSTFKLDTKAGFAKKGMPVGKEAELELKKKAEKEALIEKKEQERKEFVKNCSAELSEFMGDSDVSFFCVVSWFPLFPFLF
jgi:hypothetical protein